MALVKHCSKCNVDKSVSEYAKHGTGKYGVASICKECRNIYKRAWYKANKYKCALVNAKWSQKNLHKKRAYRAKRRALIASSTPIWANLNAINLMYKLAHDKSISTGIKYEVDHIVPLQGKTVTGLHVEHNLQIIEMTSNRQKAYKFES
jgi:hypothetical protein